jgi:GT2 family glycosyltransferase
VVFLNNDTEVESDFLQEMVVAIDIEKKIEMIASKIIFFDNKSRMDSAGLLVTPDGLAKNRGLGQSANNFKESCEVFCPAGAAALFSRKLLEDIEFNGQYFDEDYGFYFEELDLGWRARLRGWNCIFAPKSVVYHLKSASAGEYSEFIAYYTNRNIFYNIIKNYPAEFFLKALVLSFLRFPFLFLGVLFGQGPGAKIRNKIGFWKMIKVMVKGFRDIILKSRKMIKKRKHIQKERIVEKRKIKKWFHDFGLSFLGSIYK